MSAINMINNRVPTERSCHIDIQHFAIQDWADAKDIVMRHIPGINSSQPVPKLVEQVLFILSYFIIILLYVYNELYDIMLLSHYYYY